MGLWPEVVDKKRQNFIDSNRESDVSAAMSRKKTENIQSEVKEERSDAVQTPGKCAANTLYDYFPSSA